MCPLMSHEPFVQSANGTSTLTGQDAQSRLEEYKQTSNKMERGVIVRLVDVAMIIKSVLPILGEHYFHTIIRLDCIHREQPRCCSRPQSWFAARPVSIQVEFMRTKLLATIFIQV